MTIPSNSQYPSHGSHGSASAPRGTSSTRMGAGDAHITRASRPVPSIPVSDTAISQADGAA